MRSLPHEVAQPLNQPTWIGVTIPFQAQLLTNWCWAASIAMAARANGRSVQQCALANELWPGKGCCGGSPQPCNGMTVRGASNRNCNDTATDIEIDDLLRRFAGTNARYQSRVLREPELLAELDADPPRAVVVGCHVRNTDTNHASVVVAHDGHGFFLLFDPCLSARQSISYDELEDYGKGEGTGTWIATGWRVEG